MSAEATAEAAEKVRIAAEGESLTTILRDIMSKPLVNPDYKPSGGLITPRCPNAGRGGCFCTGACLA